MDDALLMGVLDSVTDLHEELEARPRIEAMVITVIRYLDTMDQLQQKLLAAEDRDGLEQAYTRVLTAMETPKDVEAALRRIEQRARPVKQPPLFS